MSGVRPAVSDKLESRAVLVGVGAYGDPKLVSHPAAIRQNVIDLYNVLTDPTSGTFLPEHCGIVLDESDPRVLADKLHTAAAEASELLLFYYVGHGLLDDLRHQLHLALSTTSPDKVRHTAFSYAQVRDIFLDSPAATKVVILDCCYSGRAIDQTLADSESAVKAQIDITGTYTLTSTARQELALTLPGEAHTVFTGRLLRALETRGRLGLRPLTLDALYNQLRRETLASGQPTPERCGVGNAEQLILVRPLPSNHPERLAAAAPIAQAAAATTGEVARMLAELAERKGLLDAQAAVLAEQMDKVRRESAALAEERDRFARRSVVATAKYEASIRARAEAVIRDAGVLQSVNGILDEALAYHQAKIKEADAHYEEIRSSAAAAATDFETKLARRREHSERDLAARQEKAEKHLSLVETRIDVISAGHSGRIGCSRRMGTAAP